MTFTCRGNNCVPAPRRSAGYTLAQGAIAGTAIRAIMKPGHRILPRKSDVPDWDPVIATQPNRIQALLQAEMPVQVNCDALALSRCQLDMLVQPERRPINNGAGREDFCKLPTVVPELRQRLFWSQIYRFGAQVFRVDQQYRTAVFGHDVQPYFENLGQHLAVSGAGLDQSSAGNKGESEFYGYEPHEKSRSVPAFPAQVERMGKTKCLARPGVPTSTPARSALPRCGRARPAGGPSPPRPA